MSEPVVDPIWARPVGAGDAPPAPGSPTIPLFDASAQLAQVALRLRYQDAVRLRAPLPNWLDAEFSCFSQNGEDGLLLLLFSVIGTTNRRAVEICAGDGLECNVANLIVYHGWDALLVDGNPFLIKRGRGFYAHCRSTLVVPPTMAHAWITAENVNSVVTEAGFAGDVDLLSMDVDGNDYWILEALTCVRPRVIVVEFNGSLGPSARLSMPYDPEYRLDFTKPAYRCGASLAAFVALCKNRGYRLVGVQSLGFNAFFVRDDAGLEAFPGLEPGDCFARTPRLARWNPGWLDLMLSGGAVWQEV